MAYSEDPAILVTGSYDHTLRFWDAFKEESVKYIEYGNDVDRRLLQALIFFSILSIKLKFLLIKLILAPPVLQV
jgi:hypothetical protein